MLLIIFTEDCGRVSGAIIKSIVNKNIYILEYLTIVKTTWNRKQK